MNQIYQTIVLEHVKNPQNKGLKGFTNLRLYNPSCGDDLTVEIDINNSILRECNFEGIGCSLCCSSASIMTTIVKGKMISEVKRLINDFSNLLKGETVANIDDLEDAKVYINVRNFPARLNCVSAAWKILEELVENEEKRL